MSWNNDYLMHYGIKGQRWGVRNYQEPNGKYTKAGLLRYFGRNSALNVKQREKNVNYDKDTSAGVYVRDKDKGPVDDHRHRDSQGGAEGIDSSRWTPEYAKYAEGRVKGKWDTTSPIDMNSVGAAPDVLYPHSVSDETDKYLMTFGNIDTKSKEYKIVQRDPSAFYADGNGNVVMSVKNAEFLEEAGIDLNTLDDFLKATGKNGILHINKNGIAGFPFTYIKELKNKEVSEDVIPMASHFMNKKGKTQPMGPNKNDRPKGHDIDLPKEKPKSTGKIIYFNEADEKKAKADKAKANTKATAKSLSQKYVVQATKNVATAKGANDEFADNWKYGFDSLTKKKKKR